MANFQYTQANPDARNGALKSVQITLQAAGNVTTVTLPDNARGFRIYSDGAIRFAIGENPAAVGTGSGATVGTGDFSVGGIIRATTLYTRYLESGPGRTLRLYAVAGGEVVDLEVF